MLMILCRVSFRGEVLLWNLFANMHNHDNPVCRPFNSLSKSSFTPPPPSTHFLDETLLNTNEQMCRMILNQQKIRYIE